ncbi:hypothetical protein N7448_010280 [Penicillium atrosanguineum]|nr:hypothetical protein N7526_010209 [Penicillium atrosanguineum]KAJ5119611.1 hypothetical protein N7448_010280 [Penicillium atrosanguineum]
MAGNTEQIAVDPDFYSMATGYGTEPQDFQSETTSIASAIARGRFENGRRYQATKEDDYWGPSDEQQFEAFEIGHMNILDIGTGQGSWAIDVADLYPYRPRRRYFPPPVSWMPPNCVFEVDDVLREWTWRESFDFIHLRLMYGAFAPDGWDQVYKQAYDALEPGGWIEQMEIDVRVYSDDDAPSEQDGRSELTKRCAAQLRKPGLWTYERKSTRSPLGPWAKDKLLKEAGHLQFAHWNAALEGWAMWLLTHFGEPEPWTKEEVQVYLSKVRKELRDPHIHAYEPGNRVWARKPTKEELKAREASFKVETSP